MYVLMLVGAHPPDKFPKKCGSIIKTQFLSIYLTSSTPAIRQPWLLNEKAIQFLLSSSSFYSTDQYCNMDRYSHLHGLEDDHQPLKNYIGSIS